MYITDNIKYRNLPSAVSVNNLQVYCNKLVCNACTFHLINTYIYTDDCRYNQTHHIYGIDLFVGFGRGEITLICLCSGTCWFAVKLVAGDTRLVLTVRDGHPPTALCPVGLYMVLYVIM